MRIAPRLLHRRASYYWLLEVLGLYKPVVWEYSRLNITNTVMSKRKLNQLVMHGHVHGWDDPRLLTLAGLRRRGVNACALNAFCREIGITRNENLIPMHKLEHHIRADLDASSPRTLAVLRPLRVVITNLPEGHYEEVEGKRFPGREEAGYKVRAGESPCAPGGVVVDWGLRSGGGYRAPGAWPNSTTTITITTSTTIITANTATTTRLPASPPCLTACCTRASVHPCRAALILSRLPSTPLAPSFPSPPFVLPASPPPQVPFTRVVYLEETDFREQDDKDYYGLAPGKAVMLRYAYPIKCTGYKKDPSSGRVVEVRDDAGALLALFAARCWRRCYALAPPLLLRGAPLTIA